MLEYDEVISIEKIDYDGYVYDLEVENDSTFLANDIFVHNTDSTAIQLPNDPREVGTITEIGEPLSRLAESVLRAKYGNEVWQINMPAASFASELRFTRTGGGERGAKKRRFERIVWDAKRGACDYYNTVGLEKIRSDQFALLERTQDAILKKSLKEGFQTEAEAYLTGVGEALLQGFYPVEDFIISKGFGREMDAYRDKGVPPHVRARRMLEARGLWSGQDSKIHYVWGTRGVTPYVKGEDVDVDYNHYWGLIKRMAQRVDVDVSPLSGVGVRSRDSSLDLFSS